MNIPGRKLLRRNYYKAAIDDRAKLEMHLREILGTLDTFQAIKEFLSTARLTAALASLVAADKFFRMSDMYLLRLIFALAAVHTFLAQVKILGIGAGILFNMTK